MAIAASPNEAGGTIMLVTIRRLAAIAAAVAVVVGAAIASGARAGEISQQAAAADRLIETGEPEKALAAFDLATAAFWRAGPLQFRTATFANSVGGFGQYEPRENANFRSGETATVYLAPVGYGFIEEAASERVALRAALEIRTPGGLILAKSDDFGELAWQGRTRSYEVHAAIRVALPDLKPGDYVLRLTLADRASAKSASVALPFAIVE